MDSRSANSTRGFGGWGSRPEKYPSSKESIGSQNVALSKCGPSFLLSQWVPANGSEALQS